MDAPTNGNGASYSADVRMHLFVNDHILNISHLGRNFVILRSPIAVDPSDAEISLVIDGHESRLNVRLVDGIRADRPRTPMSVAARSPSVATHS